MSTEVERLVAVLEADVSRFKSGLATATADTNKFASKTEGRMTKVRGSINKLGGAIFNLKSAFASVGAGLLFKNAIEAGAKYESQMGKLNGIIRSTGGAAQLSAQEIDAFAVSLGESTLTSAGAVRDAAGILLTFKSVAKETFTDTLSLAQDLSATGFGDLKSTTLQLGKALEDPILGMTALRRSGVMFSDEQQNMIKSLLDANDKLGAQAIILQEVRKQVGGAAQNEAKGFAGAVDTMGERWTAMNETFSKSGILDYLTALVSVFSDDLKSATEEGADGFVAMSEIMIDGIGLIIKGVGFLKTAFTGIQIIWKTLEMGFEGFKLLLLTGIEDIVTTINAVKTAFGGEPIDKGAIKLWAEDSKANIEQLQMEMDALALAPTGLQEADDKLAQIQQRLKDMTAEREKAAAKPIVPLDVPTPGAGAGGASELYTTADKEALANKLADLQAAQLTERELLEQHWAEKAGIVGEALTAGVIQQADADAALEELRTDHLGKVAELDNDAASKGQLLETMSARNKVQAVAAGGSQILGAVSQGNKSIFKAHKALALGSSLVALPSAVMQAFSNAGGFPTGIPAALATAGKGAGLISSLKGISLGSGGGTPSLGGGGGGGAPGGSVPTPGVPGVAEPNIPQGGRGGGTNITVDLGDEDTLISTRAVRSIIEKINEQKTDGVPIESIVVA